MKVTKSPPMKRKEPKRNVRKCKKYQRSRKRRMKKEGFVKRRKPNERGNFYVLFFFVTGSRTEEVFIIFIFEKSFSAGLMCASQKKLEISQKFCGLLRIYEL